MPLTPLPLVSIGLAVSGRGEIEKPVILTGDGGRIPGIGGVLPTTPIGLLTPIAGAEFFCGAR